MSVVQCSIYARQHYLTHVAVCYSPSELKESQQLQRLQHCTTKKKVITSLFHDCAQIITPHITTFEQSSAIISWFHLGTLTSPFLILFFIWVWSICVKIELFSLFSYFWILSLFLSPELWLLSFSLSWCCIICQILMGTADSCGSQLWLWLFQPQLSYL